MAEEEGEEGVKTCQVCEATSAGTSVRFSRPRVDICDWCFDEHTRRGVRWCKGCGGTFPLARATRSYPFRCPACRAADRRAYYEAHQEHEKATTRAWREANREEDAARKRYYYATNAAYREDKNRRAREWRARNRERLNELMRAYRERNRAKRIAYTRRWQEENKERHNAYQRLRRVRIKLAILRGERSAARSLRAAGMGKDAIREELGL